MSKKIMIPAYNHGSTVHRYIWNFLAYDLTDDDFEAIEEILKTRKEDRERIDRSEVFYASFSGDPDMFQPRPLDDYVKKGAYKYTNWSAATDILLLITKYTDMYSKKV